MREKVYIAVCDKDQQVHDEVRQFLSVYGEERKVDCVLTQADSTAELFSSQHAIDILLLEFEMTEPGGMETAFRLKEHGVDCRIIMLTCRTDRFKDAFKIGAIRFVTKPIDKEELFEALDAARKCVEGRRLVKVFLNSRAYYIMQREISYIMSNGSETRVFTDKLEYRSEIALCRWKERLDEHLFFSCHRSYLVNLSKISKIEKTDVILKTGKKIPIARRKQKELMMAYIENDIK